ncbi:anthranilate synthase component II [Entomobacter blattae]|uniref:Anthranilate synthase component 2 n=1 Tax=Entomobacter blattae TaxID=2762277 RepID=A0A7H1NSF6_9PROT|nr:aminodeoxychorismate/anthranilate synthase component II [Entomobacter blattae]QNT78716.1 Anthranilate synthase component 2 [Entomobacter blattae]
MLLLIDNYDSFTFNLVHYFGELGASCHVVRNDAISVEEALEMQPEAIVISPGPCSPDEAGICCDLITQATGRLPILGVCLGHQAIGQAFGGKVVRAPHPVHGKTSSIHHQGTDIFEDIPEGAEMTRYHSLVVEQETFPEALAVTAHTEEGIIMGLRHKLHPIFGVQFHPESIASRSGHKLLENFLRIAGRKNATSAVEGSCESCS